MEHSINMSNVHINSHLTFHQAGNTIVEMKNPEHFRWKFDGNCDIAIITDNPVALDTVISFPLCNCKDNIFVLCSWGGHMII